MKKEIGKSLSEDYEIEEGIRHNTPSRKDINVDIEKALPLADPNTYPQRPANIPEDLDNQ